MANTFVKIASATVGSGGSASMTFSSIPSTYTDLCLKVSGRVSGSGYDFRLNVHLNGNTSGYTQRAVFGTGSSVFSYSASIAGYAASLMGSSGTANTFGNAEIYIPNYAGSTNKSYSVDNVTELNASTNNRLDLLAGLWSNTSAVSSITVTTEDGTAFVQYSTATLYGIKKN
jgi:hypothetical protein